MKLILRSVYLAITDIFLITIGILIAFLLRNDGHLDSELIKGIYFVIIAANIIKLAVFAYFKLYSSLWRYAGVYEVISIIKASFLSNILLFGYTYFFYHDIPKSIFLITLFIDIAFIGGVRLLYRIARRLARVIAMKGQELKNVLIIGGGEAGAAIIKELVVHPEHGSRPAAIIDDDIRKTGRKINGIPIIGGREHIIDAVNRMNISEIIMAIPSAGKQALNDIYNECSKTNCRIRILPGVSQLIDGSVIIQRIRDVNVEDLLGREPVRLNTIKIESYIKNQVILVTGGGGSIGSELCRQIVQFAPKKLILTGHGENSIFDIEQELKEYPIVTEIVDVKDTAKVNLIFEKYKPSVVFHDRDGGRRTPLRSSAEPCCLPWPRKHARFARRVGGRSAECQARSGPPVSPSPSSASTNWRASKSRRSSIPSPTPT
jgi:FlaA1/EpsC-like NDP-sugar epimerase